MPEYKKQHYLPAAYLKYFSNNQAVCNRQSRVYRFDGSGQYLVSVASQCFENYFYSKEKAAETEMYFQRGENVYCECVDKIRSGRPINSNDGGNLLLMMFDFHLRNAAHKNLTGKEGIDAYLLRNRIFTGKLLLGRQDNNITLSDIVAHVSQHWSIQIVSASSSLFITSDHPSVFTPINLTRPSLEIVTLPLTPKYTAVGFDKRSIQIIGDEANPEDEATLNAGQLANANRCIYGSNPTNAEGLATINNHFKNKKNDLLSEVSENAWKITLEYLPPEHHFSFMRLKPPLF